uniref:hypothetical protein n=1 Tax=Streptomyces tubercidicus TaxID=47759 RepID=UPI0037DDDCBA|nr:hypothetical protein OG690_38120 [Streptomyces tubercidicus]
MSSNFSPSTRRFVIKGAVANVLQDHAGSPDLASLIADAVMETVTELDKGPTASGADTAASH